MFLILVPAINKKVVKDEILFLKVLGTWLYNNKFPNYYKT